MSPSQSVSQSSIRPEQSRPPAPPGLIYIRPLHWGGGRPGQALWLDVSTLTLLIQKSINKTGILTQFFTAFAFSPQLKFRTDSCLICHFNYQRYFPLWEKYLKRPSSYLWIWLIFGHYHASMVHMCLQKWIESLCLMCIVYIFTKYFYVWSLDVFFDKTLIIFIRLLMKTRKLDLWSGECLTQTVGMFIHFIYQRISSRSKYISDSTEARERWAVC